LALAIQCEYLERHLPWLSAQWAEALEGQTTHWLWFPQPVIKRPTAPTS